MYSLWIILGIAAVIILVVIAIYNSLVRLRNLAEEGWSGIDVQLKRRSDLVPNLVETVKSYMKHEREILEKVTEMRGAAIGAGNLAERSRAESGLSGALGNLFAVAENYPDLKASQNFQDLQKALSDTEEQIQLARRYYNGAVRDLNIKIQSFPNNLIAGTLGFKEMKFFEMEDPAERNTPQVTL